MSIGHASITKILVKADGRIQVISVGDVGHIPPNLLSGTSADTGERSLEIPALQ
jgi:serine/threonine-protein phosphatase PGAM5